MARRAAHHGEGYYLKKRKKEKDDLKVRTSRHGNLQAPDWKMNAVGRSTLIRMMMMVKMMMMTVMMFIIY